MSWATKKPAIAFDACANVIDGKGVPGYAASKSFRYSGMAPSLAISALQMPVKSLSGICASSLRVKPAVVIATVFCPRISVRDVTGKRPIADAAPNSNTCAIAGVTWSFAGVWKAPAASTETRPSQKS